MSFCAVCLCDGILGFGELEGGDPRLARTKRPYYCISSASSAMRRVDASRSSLTLALCREKDVTAHITAPISRRKWMRQPMPYIKGESKDDRKQRREDFLFQRSIPAPFPYAVLHGNKLIVPGESTV